MKIETKNEQKEKMHAEPVQETDKSMGSEADRFNLAETRANALGSLGGGQPRSIRTRGYYRALKRNEPWARHKKAFEETIRDMNIEMFSDMVYKPNPFLGRSTWIPNTNGENFFGTDRTVRLRYPSKPSLWTRIREMFSRAK